MAKRYRPAYLAHLRVSRWIGPGTWQVLLEPEGRPMMPPGRIDLFGEVPDFADLHLGLVAPRLVETSEGSRPRVRSWGFNRWGHPDEGGSGAYGSRREAAESCAVEAIEGAAARQRFNVERERRRRSAR